jgi:hypothetical protein
MMIDLINEAITVRSSNFDSLTFENFKSSIIIIPFPFIIRNIAVVDVIIDGLSCFVIVGILGRWLFDPIIIFKVVPECGVISIVNGLEFTIGVEAEDCAEGIVDETKDRVTINKLLHAGIATNIVLVLNGGEEEDHEIDGEEDTDEDVDHDDLIAELVLHDVEQEEKEDTEYSLPQEGSRRDEV